MTSKATDRMSCSGADMGSGRRVHPAARFDSASYRVRCHVHWNSE